MDFFVQSPVRHFAERTPNHEAVAFQGRSLTYRELDAASNQLAHALLARGIRLGDRVGIHMHKSLELPVAIYGILKAGAAFVPLDPLLPEERLGFILRDCEIDHVVTSPRLAAKITESARIRRVHLFGVESGSNSTSWGEIRGLDADPPDLRMIDLDLAYIMYTSGSTGEPKGMMHTHRGSVSYARWGALHVGLRPEDRVASHAPLHFDLSIFDFFSTAQTGGTVVLVPEPVTKFPASWTQHIADERITAVFTVPYTLIEMLERGVMEQRDLSSLRWILFGGEPFPPKHLRALMEALPDVRFTNVYGPAEAPSCTCYDVPDDFPEPVPIGTASRNSEALIVDENDRELGTGIPGELCIRSSTLTLGYWKRPDLNGRAFLERDGHGTYPDIFFRTGDVVERGEDGLLRFLGRRDRMIKTRGHRVELDDVESALTRHDGVQEAAAYDVPDGRGTREIRAAVTVRGDARADVDDLIRHLRGLLPSYAIPAEVAIVAELPRTRTGKIDRNALAKNPPEAGR